MGSENRKKVIHCPLRNRETEITYRIVGSWFRRDYDILSCPAMHDRGGCDRRCKQQLAVARGSADWYQRG